MEASPRDIVYVLDADDAGAGGKDPTQLAGPYLPSPITPIKLSSAVAVRPAPFAGNRIQADSGWQL